MPPRPLTLPRAAAWAELPAPLRQRLALASTGSRHLAQAGSLCLGLAPWLAAEVPHLNESVEL